MKTVRFGKTVRAGMAKIITRLEVSGVEEGEEAAALKYLQFLIGKAEAKIAKNVPVDAADAA